MPSSRETIVTAVRHVLESAATGKGVDHHYLTAYQILARLPEALRTELLVERGAPGQGAGRSYTAASYIGQIAGEISEHTYLDARGLTFEIDDVEPVAAGYPVVRIYRVPRA